MTDNFNTYYDNIDSDFWRNLCVEKGVLRHYGKGELFAEEGHIAKYIGYVKSGALFKELRHRRRAFVFRSLGLDWSGWLRCAEGLSRCQ